MDFFKLSERKSLTKEKVLEVMRSNEENDDLEKVNEILAVIYALANLLIKVELRLSTKKEN